MFAHTCHRFTPCVQSAVLCSTRVKRRKQGPAQSIVFLHVCLSTQVDLLLRKSLVVAEITAAVEARVRGL